MKNMAIIKRNLLILLTFTFHLSPFTSLHAQRVLADDWQHLTVEFTMGNVTVGETTLCGETFSTLAIEGCQPSLSNYGDPCLPLFSRMIEVPLGAEFAVEITDAVYDTLKPLSHWLVPVQMPRSKSDTTTPKLLLNAASYQLSATSYQLPTYVEAVGIARDRRLARLQFAPVSYNPVSGQVVVCRRATVTVTYQGGDEQASREMFDRYYSPAFNSGANPLNNLYSNLSPLTSHLSPSKAVRTTAPVRMLIVANAMFRNHLDDFVAWKQRKGFLTDIVYTDDPAVGSDTTSIAAYIKGQYTNATTANPAPTYVLLVGDVAQLPPFSAHNSSPDSDHITDLYYSTWTAGDHLPDCHYGRFSAQNVSQLEPQVAKTLMYEQYTFADPSFLDRAVMVAGVDAGNAGDNGYTYGDPAMDYAITNYVNGTHGWSQVMYFKNDVSIVPSCTTNVTLGSSASGNAATVRSYYNQGAGFINYTAHGGSDGWGTPNFGNTHVNQMTNTQKFGLMIGNCCLTNKFEVSTCFGEALLRKGGYAGAVGYIGGSNSTYWGQDFYWAVGVRSSIGPSMSMAYDASHLGVYDRTFHTHSESYSNWCTTQGSMVMQGNMAVENSSSGTGMKWYYWEIYHLMGDPSVMPYMTQADTMTVAVASMVNYGATSLAVSAVPHAYVALVDTVTSTLIAAAYADGIGSATLALPSDLSVGSYLLAASAQQYRTAFRTLQVIQPDGPFPVVTAITSDPLNAGDTVPLTLHVENPGNATAYNISIQLTSGNPMVTLSTNFITLDSLVAGAALDVDSTVVAYVNAATPDNSYVDFATSATWTSSTIAATSTLRRSLYAPVLTLVFSPAIPTLMPGASTTVTATLRNSGHAPTRPDNLVFTSATSLLTVAYSSSTFSLAPENSLPVTLTLQADSQLPQGIYIPIDAHYSTLDAQFSAYLGPTFMETFEGGTTHLAGWSSPASYPWSVSTEQPYEGSYCLRSVTYTAHNTNSDMNLTVNVAVADTVSFYYRVSSESNYDKFHFLVDNESQMEASGEVEWTHAAFPLTAGTHTLTFRYAKDYSVSNGSDCAWIDNVVLPATTVPATFATLTFCQGQTAVIDGDTIDTSLPTSGTLINSQASPIAITDYAVVASYLIEDTAVACGSYEWNGTEYTASGDYTYGTSAEGGCDSVATLHLTVKPIRHEERRVAACDSYEWRGVVYTADTAFTETFTAANGCDSLLAVTIMVHYSYADTLWVDTSAAYTWEGSTYSFPGTYEHHYYTSYGCDSTLTLVLTITLPEDTSLAIQEISIFNSQFSIYPNPSHGDVTVKVGQPSEVTVIDMQGRTVIPATPVNSTLLIPHSSLPAGTYFLRATGEQTTLVRKLIIQ
jgi:hypothetical protein